MSRRDKQTPSRLTIQNLSHWNSRTNPHGDKPKDQALDTTIFRLTI